MGGLATQVAMIVVAALVSVATALETSVGSDPFTWLINLGVAGIVIVLLVTGQLRTKAEVEQLQRENANKDQQLKEKTEALDTVHQVLLEQTLPALAKSTRVIESMPDAEGALIQELRETQRQIANWQRERE